MAMWLYNGVPLPQPPYSYSINGGEYVIVKIDGEYYFYYADWSSTVWCVDKTTGQLYCRAGSSHDSWKYNGSKWVQQADVPANTLLPAYGENIVYNSDDVSHSTFPNYTIFDDNYLDASPAPLTEWTAETPTILSNGADATYKRNEEALPLTCNAEVSDGGTLSYEWFKDGISCGTGNEIYPETNIIGVFQYYCVVTNNLGGVTASTTSESRTITVMRGLQWPGLTAFLVQFALGLCNPIPLFSDGEAKNPVAYLYNGIRLPALPEWDRGVYPYATIAVSSGKYLFTAWAAKPYCSGNFALFAPVGEGRISLLSCWASVDNSGWGEFTSGELADNGAGSADKPFWADWDVLDENGNVWLAATDPVPVYE